MKSRLGPRRGIAGGFRWLTLAATVVAAVAAAPRADAADRDLQALIERLDRIERDVQVLHRQAARGGTVPGKAAASTTEPSLARLGLRLTELEGELRQATGMAEELVHRMERMERRLEKLIGDVDFRLRAVERTGAAPATATAPAPAPAFGQGGAAGPPQVSTAPSPPPVQKQKVTSGKPGGFATAPQSLGTVPQTAVEAVSASRMASPPPAAAPAPQAETPPPAAAAPGVLPEGTPRERYIYAFGLLRQARYDDAETALKAFLETHADDPLAGNARYWLGETFYVRGDYMQAAEVFLQGYQQAPSGPKAPDTLLKLGMALANLDKRQEACAAFDKLEKDFTDLPANIVKVMARERQRNDCR